MADPGLYLFAYGTLQIPEVMQAVTGNKFPSVEAVLNGYCRYSIRNEVYPAIIAQANTSVSGRLYSGLERSTLDLLDNFESEIYTRCDSNITTADNIYIIAQVYVLSDQYRSSLSDEPWELEWFRQNYLDSYLENCRKFFIRHNRK